MFVKYIYMVMCKCFGVCKCKDIYYIFLLTILFYKFILIHCNLQVQLDIKHKPQTIYMHNIGLFFCFCQVCFNLCLCVCMFNVVGFLHILSLSYFWSNLIFICPILSLLDLLWGFVCLYVYHCGCCLVHCQVFVNVYIVCPYLYV